MYAYHPKVGPATVRIEVTDNPLAVVITFVDNGVPFDPLAKADPDITQSAEKRAIGGLGIYLVKKAWTMSPTNTKTERIFSRSGKISVCKA